MALYAIGDLHLSLTANKSMEVFGPAWEHYVDRIGESLSQLTAQDVLVLAGDTSWGIDLAEAEADFRFLEQFPCKKLLVKGIRFNLENEGYEVITGCDGMEAVELAGSENPDLIVLDLMMPRLDGLEACGKIREFSDVPIIMLTAKADDMDKLLGFEHGADDYLTKPFNILELKARIKALLRRSRAGQKQQAQPDSKLVCGHITLDRDARDAFNDGQLVDLTAKEFDLMELLMRNPNRVYSRESLLNAIWGYDTSSDIRTVDVHIRRLREKLERSPAAPEHIMTKWGVGYYFKF